MRKGILILLTLFTYVAKAQTTKSLSGTIFYDDFSDNRNNWTIADTKQARSKMDSGFYYLTAKGHACGETHEITIDTRKNFEIETRIKILNGEADHKNYYSMIFWGREAMQSNYFTFARDGFASVEICGGKNQSDCITESASLKNAISAPDDFNIYTIRKIGNRYFFFINGAEFYEMPFTPFFGNLIGFGAGRKSTLEIDYLKVVYL